MEIRRFIIDIHEPGQGVDEELIPALEHYLTNLPEAIEITEVPYED